MDCLDTQCHRFNVRAQADHLQWPAEGRVWGTDQLNLGDELRITAAPEFVPGHADPEIGHMRISAELNGVPVALPMNMQHASFAMELWPYVAVCGRVPWPQGGLTGEETVQAMAGGMHGHARPRAGHGWPWPGMHA